MKKTINVTVSPLLIAAGLLFASNVTTLALWQPWSDSSTTTRTVKVTGTGTIKAEPDQFTFSPYYERPTAAEIAALSTDLIKKLQELGVAEKDIKSSASKQDYTYFGQPSPDNTLTLQLEVQVGNKDLSQKVQDYLVTTSPKGSISPYATFTPSKQKDLNEQAKNAALEDAKKQAEKTIQTVGGKLGKVQSIEDGSVAFPMAYSSGRASLDIATSAEPAKEASLPVAVGQNEVTISVQVTYQLR